MIAVQLQSQTMCSNILHPPPEAKTHSTYNVKLQKEVKSTQNSQAVKKVWPVPKRQHEKSYEIQGSGPEVAVMVGQWQNFNNSNSGEFCADS